MTDAINPKSFPQLQRAYHFIKEGEFDRAGRIIARTLQDDPQNVDGWWLAVFVTPDIERKRTALIKVLALQPDHTQARTLLQKLGAPSSKKKGTSEISLVGRQAKKRQVKWFFVVMMVIGVLASLAVPFILLDNFAGGEVTDRIERLLFGEPDAIGWVNIDNGGFASAEIASDERIPIVKQARVSFGGSPIVDVLARGEAHQYLFNAKRGDELVIAVAFTQDDSAEVIALELWSQDGNQIAHEILDLPFDVPFLSGRAMTYNVIRDGAYSVVIVGRDRGPSGNYTLVLSTLDDVLDEYDLD